MLFFICETKGLTYSEKSGNGKPDRKFSQELRVKVEDFNQHNTSEYYGFIHMASAEKTKICFAAQDKPIPSDKVTDFLALLDEPDASYTLKEITMKSFIFNAESAERRGFIEDATPLFLVNMNVDSVTKKDLMTLVYDDFEAPSELKRDTRKIGFTLQMGR